MKKKSDNSYSPYRQAHDRSNFVRKSACGQSCKSHATILEMNLTVGGGIATFSNSLIFYSYVRLAS